MSHLHEREEKVCLNCGANLIGRYCQDCGQENLEPKESAWHLIVHFFNDFTHFDGKLFSTLKPLFLKPGFLTEEYMKGRRAAYLNPIRMYLFISAVFFLLFMTFFIPKIHQEQKNEHKKATQDRRNEIIRKGGFAVTVGKGMTDLGQRLDSVNTTVSERLDSVNIAHNKRKIILLNGDTVTDGWVDNWRPPSVEAYDSLQKLLPKNERDGWLEKYIARKTVSSTNYMRSHKEEAVSHIMAGFFHSLPYMLFLSLPVLALLLKLLYIRRRKEFIYVSHGIFIIHFFCVMFLSILLMLIFNRLTPWGGTFYWIILIGLYIYLYQAMRYFYKQGWFKTLVKFLLFWAVGITFIFIVFLIGAVNSTLNVAS